MQVISIRKLHLYDCSVPVVPIKVFSRTQTRDPDGSAAFTIVPGDLDRRSAVHAVPDLARRRRPDGQADPVAAARGERTTSSCRGPR